MATMFVSSVSSRSVGTDLFIKLNVVDGDGAPVDAVRVKTNVYHEDGWSVQNSKKTDELGDDEFRIGNAPSGLYVVFPFSLTKEGYTWDTTHGVRSAEVAKP